MQRLLSRMGLPPRVAAIRIHSVSIPRLFTLAALVLVLHAPDLPGYSWLYTLNAQGALSVGSTILISSN
jgi:hypothetical protein